MDNSSLKLKAESNYNEKKYSEAAQNYLELANQSSQEGNEIQAAEFKNNASVAFLLAGNCQAAYESSFQTELVFLKAGNQKFAGMSLGNQAAALEELGKNKEALELFEKGAQFLKEAGENDLRAYILKRISAIKLKQGHHLEALATMDNALDNVNSLSKKERFLKRLSNFVFKLIRG
ncbi:MAG: hypothetical protein ACYDH1_04100 [Anaerolineaceae bacterium]